MSCGSKQPLKSCLRGSSGGGGGGGSSHSLLSSRTVTSRTSGGGRFSGSSCGGGSSRSSYAGGGGASYGMSSSSCGGRLGGYGMGHCSMGTGFRTGGSSFGGGYGGGFGGGGAGFSAGSFGSGGFQGGNVGILSYDEKLTMQSLNERLASYLETVRNLEKENAQLEQLIREWYQKQGPIGPKDYSHYYGQIEELQKQIVATAVETHKVLLDLDNTKMTAEDFRIKYEMETGLRQSVEGDLNSLRPLLDNLTLTKSDLEMQFESLKEEIIDLKKNHEEEMKLLQSQSNGDVNVKINAAPGEDLLKKLNEMRQEYEAIIQKNRAEVEKWYESKMEEVSQQVHSSSQEIESSNQQISVLRREFQSLEIELQSQISLVDSLQSNLEDTERRYNMQLQQIQGMIGPLEEELASIRCEMESQNEEYKMLLGIKTRLEQEIQQYRALLEEGQQGVSTSQGGAGGSSSGGGGHGGSSGGGSCWSPRSSGGKTEGSYGRTSSSESGGGGSGGRTGGGTCGKTSSGGGGSGGGGGGKSSSQSQPGDSSESPVPGSAENMKLCLEGNKTLERGATMEEVSEAIKQMRWGSFRKAEE
ncbi:PREDICTED: keratin, type I cytoskeletal 10-like isoform X1 [Ficedula albicollis]|uniref:keratin, type I cytoskeletal 10-like isoform X1 n=1 Tax=Ficedula albicollis TaxID=59894 RepID=UPI000359C7AE|nr:PREDICTED: keratin, type I cytoskeletal 10-like isoform X1 [Ficedula albicollis]